MNRSLFLELMDEETSIPKSARGAFASMDEVMKVLGARAALMKKIDAAKANGQLTDQQYERLIALNRQHSLPQG